VWPEGWLKFIHLNGSAKHLEARADVKNGTFDRARCGYRKLRRGAPKKAARREKGSAAIG
jgi:hypothetical protein